MSMFDSRLHLLAHQSTERLRALVESGTPCVALVPVGSVEPHGPHLPLFTDTAISDAAAQSAIAHLAPRVHPLIAPAINYGVTDYARGFAGAVSIPAAVLTSYVRAAVEGLLAGGFAHVCLVNNHLEPAHDAAVRAAATGLEARKVSVACPLARRWARTLSDEFKRGQCHAGRYETSIVLAHAPGLVDEDARRALGEVPISLSQKIAEGVTDFAAMGLAKAYAGAPAQATAGEGAALIEKLGAMVAAEVLESLFGGSEDANARHA